MEGKEAAAAAEDAGDEESEEELDLVPMKAGDYMIHVFIEKGKIFRAMTVEERCAEGIHKGVEVAGATGAGRMVRSHLLRSVQDDFFVVSLPVLLIRVLIALLVDFGPLCFGIAHVLVV